MDEVVVVAGHAQSVDELFLVAEVSRWTKALSVRAARRCWLRLEGEREKRMLRLVIEEN